MTERVGMARAALPRRWPLLAAAAIVAVAARARLRNAGDVLLGGGELLQWDGDSAYHLKRILHAIADFPSLPRFDPAMSWPSGAPCPWPDGFDLLAAAFGLVAGLGDPARAGVAVAFFTPVLGLAVVWAAVDVARVVLPDGPERPFALAATGLLAAVSPPLVAMSRFGYLDHHAAEILAALLLAGWALRRVTAPGGAALRSPVAWELAGAAAATFAVWVFAGGALYVALATAVIAAGVLLDEKPRLLGSGAPGLLAAAAVSAALTVPALRAHGRLLSFQFPSLLPPLLLAAAAAGLALAIAAARIARRPPARVAVLAVLGAAAAGLAALALPHARAEVVAAISGWLLRGDPWIATIREFQHLGAAGRQPAAADLHAIFGAVGFAAPLVLAAGAWAAWRAAGARGAAFAAVALAVAALTVNQIRFARVAAPLLLVSLVLGLAAAAAALRRRGEAAAALPLAVAAMLAAADPPLRLSLQPDPLVANTVVQAARELRGAAPGEPDPGVLTDWDKGHLVSAVSGRPTIVNGFGPYLDPATFAEADAYFRGTPAELDALLARRRARFLVTGGMSGAALLALPKPSPFRRPPGAPAAVLDLTWMQRLPLSPLILGGSGIPGSDVRHLEHLMPVFASATMPPGLAFALPELWTYERVRGARLVGEAPAGARVVASLAFTERGRPHVWRAWADPGPDGRFELVVPFPSGFARPTLASARAFVVSVADGPEVEIEVPEAAVRRGDTVRVGRLRAPPTPAASRAPAAGDDKRQRG